MIGNYRIMRKIGEGGMGVVYEAEQQHPRRAVALKVIRGGRYIDDHAVRLFEREAQALARLKHSAIADIYEAGRTETGEHFAMELVRGAPLLEHFRRSGTSTHGMRRDLEARLRLFCRICEAVNYAHQRGVIHRDLKPANIMVGTGLVAPGSNGAGVPEVKILDFGRARITDVDIAAATIMTEIGRIQGTLAYMSPEQARGKTLDKHADIWAFGVVLYEMVTGRRLFEGETISDTMAGVLTKEPDWERVPAKLRPLLRSCLEKDPKRRLRDIGDARRLLEDAPLQAVARTRLPWAVAGVPARSVDKGPVVERHLRSTPRRLGRGLGVQLTNITNYTVADLLPNGAVTEFAGAQISPDKPQVSIGSARAPGT
jgi:serine/threonine protein kinase